MRKYIVDSHETRCMIYIYIYKADSSISLELAINTLLYLLPVLILPGVQPELRQTSTTCFSLPTFSPPLLSRGAGRVDGWFIRIYPLFLSLPGLTVRFQNSKTGPKR